MRRAAAVVGAIVLVAALATGSDRASRGEGTVTVVATTFPVADLVVNAGGRRVRIAVLVPRGENPREWRPGPGDREALRTADLVVRSGGALDSWAAGVAARTLTLLPRVGPLDANPHWWLDPVRVQRAVKEIRNELARVDVDGAGYYEAATADYLARLWKLDREISRCLATLPAGAAGRSAQHPRFAYFTARYGVAIGSSRRTRVVRRLWADGLGAAGTPADSYLDAMAFNTAVIVQALSGGAQRCRPQP